MSIGTREVTPTLHLSIELLSTACPAAGLGQPGVVDRDVVFDPETGLPFIPGRRVKGLLRDAYGQLLALGTISGLPSLAPLFGQPGMREAGLFQIGSARLDFASAAGMELKQWIAGKLLVPADVLAYFTEIRRQTKIDRELGSAAPDSLRFTRVLRAGLRFQAPVDGVSGSPEAVRALVLAAAGVKRMGSSRTRGYGEVRCTVWHGDQELSEPVLSSISEGGTPPTPRFSPPLKETLRSQPQPSAELRFDLSLEDAVCFPQPVEGDPNTAETFDYIPSTAIRGLLAQRYLHRHGLDDTFNRLFCQTPSGIVATGAQPVWRRELDTGVAIDHELLPVPHSMREDKSDPQYAHAPLDLAEVKLPKDFRPKRVRGRFLYDRWSRGRPSEQVTVQTDLQYHHQRAHDNRVQRALGVEMENLRPYGLRRGEQGALFVYESIAPGQRFCGRILGEPEDLARIRELVPAGDVVHLGRSRNAQYGGRARWNWLAPEKEPVRAAPPENRRVVVRLLAPMIAVNEHGHPLTTFPVEEFEEAQRPKIRDAFVRREWHGGYLSHQNLPRQQMPALAPGSTFVLDVPDGFDCDEAERRGYGLRTEEGFGRIKIYRLQLPRELWEQPARRVSLRRAPAGPLSDLALGVLKRRVYDHLRVAAGNYKARNLGGIRRHLLHRLVSVLESGPDGLERLVRELDRARETARKQLDFCRIENETLGEYLRRVAKNWETEFARRVRNAATIHPDWFQVVGDPVTFLSGDRTFARNAMRAFLARFLGELARRRKTDVQD